MGQEDWLELYNNTTQLATLMEVNQRTERFGLVLTKEDAELLLQERRDSLKEKGRVEFGEGILPKLIDAFCDSPYIYQDNYVEMIGRLQDIFYQYKNDSMDALTDDELLSYMEEEFNGDCQGSADYLEETMLEGLARRIREGSERYLRNMRRKRDVEDDV